MRSQSFTHRCLFVTSVAVFAGLATGECRGGLILSNINLTSTSLSFDLTGTVDVVGANDQDSFYIGEVGNLLWVGGFKAGTWTYNSGDYLPTTGFVSGSALGDYVQSGAATAIAVTDTVDISFSVTGASFIPGKTDVDKWVVSAGFNSVPLPDPTTITGGTAAAVPEPASLAVFTAIAIVAGARCRRKRKRWIHAVTSRAAA